MKLRFIKLAVAFFTLQSLIALGQTTEGDVENAIRQLESRRIQAMIHLNVAALDSIFADDLTYTHTNGRVDSKQQLLATLQSGELKYDAIDYQETKVRSYGETAIVTGSTSLKAKLKNQSASFNLRFTNVYVKQSGFWKMVAWQSTRLPE